MGNVEITWDREDPAREAVLKKKRNKEDCMDDDLAAYLGSDSEDGYGTDAVVSESDDGDDGERTKTTLKRRARSKFSSLLDDLKSEVKEEIEGGGIEGEVEITFEPGLKEVGGDILKNMEEKKSKEQETLWETYLKK